MNSVLILPTGDEIRDGIVLDTDSPEITRQVLAVYPLCRVTRASPLPDDEATIAEALLKGCGGEADLVVLVGGSGGGHRHSDTLGKDYTHSALEDILNPHASRAIYGKNGHLWSKMLCGRIGTTAVTNVPGPFVEARAAFAAFLRGWRERPGDWPVICGLMADAVLRQYGS
jgi:molybdopterin biosynthesis enzyme